jgi:hypothetical protein
MVNYQLGKIYKIVCRTTGEVYIGSTCEPTLARRLASHRHNFKVYYKNKHGYYISSFSILTRENYYIDLLENVPCNNNDELRKKEREWYDKIECINKQRPYTSKEDKREEKKLYRERNKQSISEYNQKYRDENKERISELRKALYKEKMDNRTPEEIEKIRLDRVERAKAMREKYKAKRENERLLNPNYEEEMKAKRKEKQRLYDLKRKETRRLYDAKRKSDARQLKMSQTVEV